MNEVNFLALARDAFSTSKTYFDANIRLQVENDIRQFQGQHHSGSKYHSEAYKSRSRLFRPKTRAAIRKNEAVAAEAFFSTSDVISIRPENDNDVMQRASAEIWQHVLQYRLSKTIPWFQTLIGAYQDAQTVGVAIGYQSWKYDQRKGIDKPDCELLPIENFRFDPAASWIDPVGTSPYLIHMLPMYVKDVKARMNSMDAKTGQPAWNKLSDATLLTSARSYSDTIRITREGPKRTDSKDQAGAINDFTLVWVHRNIIDVDGHDVVYYTLGDTEMLSVPVPIEQMYWHGKRPYVVGNCILETHKNYPSSLSNLSSAIQREVNELANQRIDNVKFALNKRYFVRRGKQVDLRSLTRNVPSSVTLMDDPTEAGDVRVVSTPDVTSSSYQEQDRLNMDFDDLAGLFANSSVASNRKLNETVGGMNILTTNSNQISGYQLRTFVETWVEPVLRQLLLLEQHYETDEVIMTLATQGSREFQRIGQNMALDDVLMQELTLNVNVGMGATNPSDQVNTFVQGMNNVKNLLADGVLERYGMDVQEVIKEVFGKIGYRDGSRFFDKNQDPQISNLQAQIQELQQKLEAKHPAELLQAQVEKLTAEVKSINAESVKRGVESAFASMQAAEVISAIPQVAPIADELMKSAGYQQPNPAGVDPNYPTGSDDGQAVPNSNGITVNPIQNRKDGMQFNPADGADPAQQAALMPHNTDPLMPAHSAMPATPGVGENRGIETKRADSL